MTRLVLAGKVNVYFMRKKMEEAGPISYEFISWKKEEEEIRLYMLLLIIT